MKYVLTLFLAGQFAMAAEVNVQNIAAQKQLAQKKVNLKVFPFMIFLGGMRGDLLFDVGSSWTLGPYVESVNWDIAFWKSKYTGGGIASTYHFGKSPNEHSLYLAPEIGYRQGRVGIDNIIYSVEGDFKDYRAAVTLGYQFSWPAINLWIGAGPEYHVVEVSRAKGTFRLFGVDGTAESDEIGRSSGLALTLDFALGVRF